MTKKNQRQAAITDLLMKTAINSQEELLAHLAEQGIQVTQTTLSRDLSELEIFKGPHGYQSPQTTVKESSLQALLKLGQVQIQQAATLVVVKTQPGHAPLLGLELDNANLSLAVGNVAGDDTVMIATHSFADAAALCRELNLMKEVTN